MVLVKCLCSKQQLSLLNSFHERDSVLLFKVSWNIPFVSLYSNGLYYMLSMQPPELPKQNTNQNC